MGTPMKASPDATRANVRYEADRLASGMAQALAAVEALRRELTGPEADIAQTWALDLARVGRGVDAFRRLIRAGH